MNHVIGLECTICGGQYQSHEAAYVCPKHGSDGILDVVYDYSLIRRRTTRENLEGNAERSIWRYLPLLPIEPDNARRIVDHTILASVGWTPLVAAPRLASQLGLNHLWIKDDARQPTASFKDRASAIAVLKARELGFHVITTASTGNAAAALAGMCTATSQPNVIFVPRTAPEGKIAQLLVYGATVLLVDGSYDDAFEICLDAAVEFGWYSRNTGYNPYMSEGKKTAAYEICEQMNWEVPDRIFVPVGDGCIIGGIYKGLRDLISLGWIDRMPRLMGVQAAGSAALADAWERGLQPTEMKRIAPHTVADSISAGLPRDRIKALRAVRESAGAFIRVSDEEILSAMRVLATGCGVFAEPAAAAAYAGLRKAAERGDMGSRERVVVLATGSGLKDVGTAIRSAGSPPVVVANVADVRRVVRQIGGLPPRGAYQEETCT
jgi:threonine synthase